MNGAELKEKMTRASFLMKLSLGVAGLSAVAASVPVLSALLAPLLGKNKEDWRTVGNLEDFPTGSTKLVKLMNANPEAYAGVTAKTAAWLRRTSEQSFMAFAVNCSHLGCPVRWEDKASLFMCPCHGGVYYKDGTVAAGPPPRPLDQYEVRIQNNKVQIKTAPMPLTTPQ